MTHFSKELNDVIYHFIKIVGVNSPDSLLFPSINHINSFYSTDNVVSIRYKPSYLNDMMKGIRLRAEKV